VIAPGLPGDSELDSSQVLREVLFSDVNKSQRARAALYPSRPSETTLAILKVCNDGIRAPEANRTRYSSSKDP
jgi:hypothetical protein